MATYIADDIDFLYSKLNYLSTIVVNNGIQVPTEGDNIMVNKLLYNITVLSDVDKTLTVTADADNESISQYQKVLLQVQLDTSDFDFTNNKYVVILNISAPTSDTLTDTEDYDYHIHLLPSLEAKGLYYLHLNEIIGNQLSIGSLNTCKFIFQVLEAAKDSSSWEEYLQSVQGSIGLYKTNLTVKSAPDDLENAFITINKIIDVI